MEIAAALFFWQESRMEEDDEMQKRTDSADGKKVTVYTVHRRIRNS